MKSPGIRIIERTGAAIAAGLLLTASVCADAPTLTNWSVVATFRPDGSSACASKFAAPRDGQTLTLEARIPKDRHDIVASFTIGGLPPLLTGKRGTLRDLTMTIGSSWKAGGLKGDWAKGAGEADSKITFVAAPAIGTVIQPIANGGMLVVGVPLVTGPVTYQFDLVSAVGPMTAFVDCIRRWSKLPD